MENIQKLLCEMQTDKGKPLVPIIPSHCTCCLGCAKLSLVNSTFALFSQRCALRTAHGIICRYNWIADYTIIMLVQGLSVNQNADSEYNV